MRIILLLLLVFPFASSAQEATAISEAADTGIILRTYIAGLKYNISRKTYNALQPGEFLTIKAEPENKYDPHAIAIYKGEEKVGFIPAQEAEGLSRTLSATPLTAIITSKGRPDGGDAMSVSIAIRRR